MNILRVITLSFVVMSHSIVAMQPAYIMAMKIVNRGTELKKLAEMPIVQRGAYLKKKAEEFALAGGGPSTTTAPEGLTLLANQPNPFPNDIQDGGQLANLFNTPANAQGKLAKRQYDIVKDVYDKCDGNKKSFSGMIALLEDDRDGALDSSKSLKDRNDFKAYLLAHAWQASQKPGAHNDDVIKLVKTGLGDTYSNPLNVIDENIASWTEEDCKRKEGKSKGIDITTDLGTYVMTQLTLLPLYE